METAGPSGTLEVPADAVTWDAVADAWVPVAAGTTAVSAVTYDLSKYLSSTWHDGQPITLADAFYSIAQGFDLAYDPDKSRMEVALAATSRPYLETIKGYRINDDDTVEVYVDYWHFDENMIAAYASPTSFSMPWEILAAMDDLVFEQRRAAYSDTAASRQNVPWLSLVMTRDAKLVDRTLRELGLKKTVPAGVFQVGDRSLVTEEEAVARYAGGAGLVRRARPPGHQQRPVPPGALRPGGPVRRADRLPRPHLPLHARPTSSWAIRPRWRSRRPRWTPSGPAQDASIAVDVEGPGHARAALPAHRPGDRVGGDVRDATPGCDRGHVQRGHRRGRDRDAVPGPVPARTWPRRATRSRSSPSARWTSR